MATIKEIANLAGVSTTTVSNVITEKPKKYLRRQLNDSGSD